MNTPAHDISPTAGRRPAPRGRARAGFTLVEILMAIAISTLILGAASFFIFSSFNLLTQAQNDPGLEHHKLGVAAFLQNALDVSLPDTAIPAPPSTSGNNGAGNTTGSTPLVTGMPGSGTTVSRSGATLATTPTSISSSPTSGLTGISTGNSTSGNSTSGNSTSGNSTSGNTTDGNTTASDSPTAVSLAKTGQVTWAWPPGIMPTEDPYLSFVLPSDNPIIVWDQGPRPPVRCFLSFKEGEGLELLWVPPPTPGMLDLNPIRRTMLSQLVTKMTYFYYDPTTTEWQNSDTPPKDPNAVNGFILPDYIRLTFDLGGKVSNVTIRVPPAQSSVPMY